MKIICIGKNYAEHVKEMKSAIPSEPVFFMKPDTALLRNGETFFLPDFSNEIHHEVEIILKVCKNGKNISEKFANNYYEEISIGIDFTARDLQAKCKEKGLPWEKAKSFDNSAGVGTFVPKSKFKDLNNVNFHLNINNQQVQIGNTKDLLFKMDTVIAYISKFITLKTGDLIYTGTPEGVGPIKANDKLEAFIEGEKLFECTVE